MDLEEITVSAPGKVILHGEHAVVYGNRAIAASLDLRTFLHLKPRPDGIVLLNLPDINLKASWTTEQLQTMLPLPMCNPKEPVPASDELIAQLKQVAGLDVDTTDTKSLALVAFLYLFGSITPVDSKLEGVMLKLASSLPTSAGLGSSAAYAVCLASSLLLHAKLIGQTKKVDGEAVWVWTKEDVTKINQWAFMAEKIIHGNPSGIDNSVSAYGGALCYQKGKIDALERVPKLRVIIMNTGIPRSTKQLVAGVRERHDKYPDIIKPVLDSIQSITVKCEQVFGTLVLDKNSTECYNTLSDLIKLNHGLLAVLGVSHPALEAIISRTSALGVQSKLTGAGGGGCAFALLPPDTKPEVITAIQRGLGELQYSCWETTVGGYGVIQHRSPNGSFSFPAALDL